MMENKRFIIGESENQCTIFDEEGIDDYYHLGNDTRDVKALCELLNDLNSENQRLKLNNDLRYKKLKRHLETYHKYIQDLEERNDKQAETIRELYTLIKNKDWKSLTDIITDLNKCEEQLQREWRTYDG